MGGYTAMVEKMLEGMEVRLNTDNFDLIRQEPNIAERIVYTGCIDKFFGCRLGALKYHVFAFSSVVSGWDAFSLQKLKCWNFQVK